MLAARAGRPWFLTCCGVSLAVIAGVSEAAQIASHTKARRAAHRKQVSVPRHFTSQVQLDDAGEATPYKPDLFTAHLHQPEPLHSEHWASSQQPGQHVQEQNTTKDSVEEVRAKDLVAIFPDAVSQHSVLHKHHEPIQLGFPDRGTARKPVSKSLLLLIGFFGLAYAVLILIPRTPQPSVPGGQSLLDSRLPTTVPAQPGRWTRRREERSPWFNCASSRALYAAFCSHGIYTGACGTTWLPFLLVMECEVLWPNHQLLLMGFAGLACSAAAAISPAASAIVDLAVRRWGQAGCRLTLRIGVMMSAISMMSCCFTASRDYTILFLLSIFGWSLGDVLVRATLEIFCGRLLGVQKCQELYELRLSSVLVGGLFGCILIIFTVCLHHYWLYFAYLFGLLFSSVCVLHALNADRTEAAGNVTKVARQPWTSWTRELVQAYSSPFRLRSGFPRVCFAYLLFGIACAPMLCMLLFVRDLTFTGPTDSQTLKAIFGLSSLFGILNGFGSAPGDAYGFVHFVWVDVLHRNTDLGMTSLLGFSGLLLLLPLIGSFGDDVVRQLMCYAVSALLGAAFGSIHRTFLECLPSVIPQGVDLVQAIIFFDMCKRLGTGLGLALVGYLLTYGCESGPGIAIKNDAGDIVTVYGHLYNRISYFVMCTFCSLFAVTSSLCLLSVPAVVSGEQRALQAADECFETTAGLPTPRDDVGRAEPGRGFNEDVHMITAATAMSDPVMMVRSASGNNLYYI